MANRVLYAIAPGFSWVSRPLVRDPSPENRALSTHHELKPSRGLADPFPDLGPWGLDIGPWSWGLDLRVIFTLSWEDLRVTWVTLGAILGELGDYFGPRSPY